MLEDLKLHFKLIQKTLTYIYQYKIPKQIPLH